MLSKLLEMDGAEVQTARGGMGSAGTRGQIAFRSCDLDISMPEMDGYQLLQELRQMPQMANVPASR